MVGRTFRTAFACLLIALIGLEGAFVECSHHHDHALAAQQGPAGAAGRSTDACRCRGRSTCGFRGKSPVVKSIPSNRCSEEVRGECCGSNRLADAQGADKGCCSKSGDSDRASDRASASTESAAFAGPDDASPCSTEKRLPIRREKPRRDDVARSVSRLGASFQAGEPAASEHAHDCVLCRFIEAPFAAIVTHGALLQRLVAIDRRVESPVVAERRSTIVLHLRGPPAA